MPRRYEQYCPVAQTLDLLGDRWTLLIIRDMLLGMTRFSEFQETLEGIPTNVLSERLKLLEANGIVERSLYSDHPPRAEYHLTRKGKDLHWVIEALAYWGSKYAVDDFRLVDSQCGQDVKPAWFCTGCGQTIKPASVRLRKGSGNWPPSESD